jgi:hypothetical protein
LHIGLSTECRLHAFLEKVYATNCNATPYKVIYFINTDQYGAVSLYPDETGMNSGSAWGFFNRQDGEVFKFQKNGYMEMRAVWVRGPQLALVNGDGSFRKGQIFYSRCDANSAAFRYAKSADVLNVAYNKFAKFEEQMIRSKKTTNCLTYQIARQSCASAGSYETCMSIRWGKDWASKESECN